MITAPAARSYLLRKNVPYLRSLCLAALLLATTATLPDAIAESFMQERIDAFRASDILFQRSDSNVPFMPIAFLNASTYSEAQVTNNTTGETVNFEQQGVSAMGGVPFLPTNRDMLVTGAYVSSTQFTSEDPERDDFRVDSIGVPLGWLRQVNPRWQAAAFVMPFGHRSTQDEGNWSLQTLGGVFGRYTQHERLWWVFGVFADHSEQESYALPYVGASWSINDRWTLSAVMPWPSVMYAPTRDWLFSLGASPSGAAWSVQDQQRDVAISLDAWDFGLTVERRLHRNLWLSAKTGVGGLRGLRYSTRDDDVEAPDIDVGASAFFALSLRIRPGELLP